MCISLLHCFWRLFRGGGDEQRLCLAGGSFQPETEKESIDQSGNYLQVALLTMGLVQI